MGQGYSDGGLVVTTVMIDLPPDAAARSMKTDPLASAAQLVFAPKAG
jgi:hypothetical protein